LSHTIDDARRLIESRIAEIEAEAKDLRRAVVGLGETGAAKRRGPGRPPRSAAAATTGSKPGRRPAREPRSGRRAARGQRRKELLAAIEADPGARPSELAKTIGVRPTQVSTLIAKVRAERLVVKSGDGYALKG
jgi:hypothetical protein